MGVAAPSVPQLTCVRKAPPRQSSREARCTTTQPAPSRAARRRPPQIILSLFLFLAAGVAEIGGGWLVWQSIRLHKGWYLAVAGAAVLFVYGVIPCAQPMDNFGRVYAIYGAFFILLSYLWGWAVDGVRPDTGDWVGSGIAIGGGLVAFFWPR
ncbi:hypothetical protein CHLNCDRAFT_23629 [Chlorella variabilis]|uniref:Uncharacterized protein n=1 Tax=Chlorella variabilis TaxID=554065 RepID=E1ZG75_CHLVA|nr:hypothetical protein CHLNCDRAFT_23629 [Chlorella variabilis]EFN55243.1 hypothetical protein CHLNCDRAFT_23629 [Chlorella variabilis]|eukprot:XP_005847345.1 hypothetical protein CHLNCDRAFT_23629 [Chlorella variabilis]